MAIYENGSIKQWNIWGTDNAGFINAIGDKRYYLKDHLGSVRAVLDEYETVISSQDYDAWGYQLQDRNYDNDLSIYKFTSKEHDEENKYDYFGARYYDARVGRWGSVDKMQDMYLQFSPYNYALLNSLKFIDPLGLSVGLPENEDEREKVLESLRLGLPSWAESYIDFKYSDGKFVIDPELLNSAPIESGSQELTELTELVNNKEMIDIKLIREGATVVVLNSNDNVTEFMFPRGGTHVGETFISGRIPNQNTVGAFSKSISGNTEVILNASKKQETVSLTLTHELLGHAHSYIKGEQWQHITLGDKFQFKVERIQENTIKNFNNR